MVTADIFMQTSIGSAAIVTTGSSFDVSRLTRKSVFISAFTAQSGTLTPNLTVNIQSSPDGSNWYVLDSKSYASGPTTYMDVFSYESHFPYLRTTTTNVTPASGASTTSTTITGRGI